MRRRTAVYVVYFGLSLLFASRFFPLAHPTSFAITEGDPALMCWSLQWVSHALLHHPTQVFAGNTFYPYPHAVVLSDSMLSLAILNAPVQLLTANPWVGHNLLIVLAYFLSCVWAAWFARELTGSDAASVWAGVFWGFLFYRVHQIGHLQILSFQALPAVAAATIRLWRRPSVPGALLVAALFVAQALVSWYLAFIETVILVVIALCQPWSSVFSRKIIGCYAVIAAIAVAALAPVAMPYRAAFADSTLAERYALVDRFGDAVHISDYLTPPSPTFIGSVIRDNRYGIWGENTLYIGYVALALSLMSLFAWSRASKDGERRRTILTGVALVVVGYTLSLGFVSPSLHIALPLHYLARMLPAVAGLRATQRFSLVLYMGILMLSTTGLAALTERWAPARQRLASAVVCLLFISEVFPFALPVHADTPYAPSAPDRAIATFQRARSTPLVVLHLPINYFREPYPVSEATYMVDSTLHWANIVNGFSGGVPQGFTERMSVLNTLPDEAGVNALADLRVDIVAVHRGESRKELLRDFFERQPWAAVSALPTGEYVVLVDRSKMPPTVRRQRDE